jgi:hypothetical protein
VEEREEVKAKQKMKEAYAIWVFSWMICHSTKSGKIDYSKLPKNFSIESENGAIAFKTDIPSTEREKLAINNVRAVTGVCFNTFDSAMNEALGKFDKTLPLQTTGLSAARVIVKQIRNAYTHDPIHPKWVIGNPTHRKTLQIIEIGLTVNLDSLNRRDFRVEHINGFVGLAKLLNYCLDNVTDE